MKIKANDLVYFLPPPPSDHPAGKRWDPVPSGDRVEHVWQPGESYPLVNLASGATSIPHRSKVPGATCNFYVC